MITPHFKLTHLAMLFCVALLFGSCAKKTESGAVDSTGAPIADKPKADINGTIQIMPPSAASQPNLVTTQVGVQLDQVSFTVVFGGSQAQTVTISGGPGGAVTLTNINPSATQPAPPPGQNISVMPTDAPPGSSYTQVVNNPNVSPNNTGTGVSTYSDALGNSVKITITAVGPKAL